MNLNSLKPNPRNPRVIKDAKFLQLVESLKQFPQMLELRPIIVGDDNVVIGGNMRLKALQSLGLTEVPDTWVKYAKELTPAQIEEFIIKDNLPFGEWNYNALANDWDLEQLQAWGLEIPDFILAGEIEQDDFVEPKEVETNIQRGDLFQIGNHRVLCGDATNEADVKKLLEGKEPYIMTTDPPYGVNYDAAWREKALGPSKAGRAVGKVSNDKQSDWTLAWGLSPSKVAYVWHGGKHAGIVQASLEAHEFEIRNQIIWAKNELIISRGDYHWKHEPCWYAVKKGSRGNWAGDRKQTTLWEIDKPIKSDTGHSTQKPVECFGRPIQNHDGDVYDPFCGTGTTLVACEQLQRTCYAMEIEPKYCQIIINRLTAFRPDIEVKELTNSESIQGVNR